MSNNNAPFGLKPLNLNGTTWSGQGKLVYIPSGQGNIFIGDPLIPLGVEEVGAADGAGVPLAAVGVEGALHADAEPGGIDGGRKEQDVHDSAACTIATRSSSGPRMAAGTIASR